MDPQPCSDLITWSVPEAGSEHTTWGGAFGLCGLTGRRSSGVWRLDLLLGDLRRYHSIPEKGEAEMAGV